MKRTLLFAALAAASILAAGAAHAAVFTYHGNLQDAGKPAEKKEKSKAGKNPQNPVVSQDLENQMLSKDPQQKVRQLDYQAQQDEERETLS